MAVWQIATTLTTVKTNLSCTVMIGYVSDGSTFGSHLWWQHVAGRYQFGPKSGHWGYWRDGILLTRTSNTNDPLFKTEANALMALKGLTVGFAEKVTPGNILGGYGFRLVTNEEFSWVMAFPPRAP